MADLSPQILLLDIQMPKLTGFEVLELVGRELAVVFVTAYDEHALRAFEVNAVDYLLKPVNRARLAQALDRVRQGHKSDDAIEKATLAAAPPARFLGRRGSAYRVVAARDVLCFVSEDGITKLYAADQHYWMSPTLNDLETRLDTRQFFRISRGAIVNLDAVREVAPTAGGHGEVTLKDGSKHEVSRRRFKELTERLGG